MGHEAVNGREADGGAALAPLRFGLFAPHRRVRHGITGRAAGLWRAGDTSYSTGGDHDRVFDNRRAWAASIGIEAADIVAVRQVHGNRVEHVTAAERGRGARPLPPGQIPAADALITAAPDTPLLLSFADCTPLLFHDPVRGVVAAAHAGWRGTVADIAGATVREMVARRGSNPADILVGIGPAIGRCCYLVDEPVVAAWQALGVADGAVLEEVEPVGGRRQWRFDLARANRLLLEQVGVPRDQIEVAGICTSCAVDRYPSHRAEQGKAGRFSAIIALARDDA